MDEKEAALDGAMTFSSLMAASFGALYPSEGYVNALFFSFLLSLFSTVLLGVAHHYSKADLRYVVASDIALLLHGPLLLILRNPLGPWALLQILVIPMAPVLLSRRRASGRTRAPIPVTRPPGPPLPRDRRGSRGRPRRGRRRGRGRRRARRSSPLPC